MAIMATAMDDLFDRKVYSVSELNAATRELLEGTFPSVWIQGEISNFASPASGHWYFTIKDDRAQVRCAMFKGDNRRVRFRPEDGALILLRARVSLYPQRGDFQLICQSMEPAGEGALRQAFEELKQKLAAEGLFDEAIKRELPPLPRAIGVVTSATGAAVRDILTTLERRWPLAQVRIYPTLVQGAQAAPDIAAAIKRASTDAHCDVLIVARGGGSLEDLWAFNDEAVARAIRASSIPVISGIGHETDFTIADFAADLRAPTPTSAAEHAVPDQQDIAQQLDGTEAWLIREMERRLSSIRERAEWAARRLDQLHPRMQLRERSKRLGELTTRLNQSCKVILDSQHQYVARLIAELNRHTPEHHLQTMGAQLNGLDERLRLVIKQNLHHSRNRYLTTTRALNAVSPLATLERGYAIVSDADGHVLKDAATVQSGTTIHARLSHGTLAAQVHTIHKDND